MLLIKRKALSGSLAWLVLFAVSPAVFAQDAGEDKGPPRDEAGFIGSLLDEYSGLTDIAQTALDAFKQKEPSLKEQADFLQARIYVKRGRTEDAQKIIDGFKAGNPKAQAVKLEMAIYFHQVGEAEKSKKLFDDFFAVYKDKKPDDPDVLNAYINASFILADIRKNEGKWGEAVKYYKQLVTGAKEKKIRRIFMVETANAYVELAKKTDDAAKKNEHLQNADKYARDAMWIYDEVFGKAIVALVNIELAKGDRSKAKSLVAEYKSDINGIENSLRDARVMHLSPRAHLRYILGEVYLEEAKSAHAAGDRDKAKGSYGRAANEFINAFLKYEGNDWSDRAGLAFKELEGWASENGYPKMKAPDGTDGKIARRLLALAKKLKQQRQFADAVPKYLEVLNAYPRTSATGEALGGLASSFAEIGDDISALATIEYAAERFGGENGDESAGTAVRSMASFWFKKKDNELAGRACKLLGLNFVNDPYSPQLLYGAAELERQKENNQEALFLYENIVNKYPGDAFAVKASGRLGFAAYDAGDFESAVKWFEKGVELSPPGPRRAEAKFRLANSYIKVNRIPNAIKTFLSLKKELDPNGPDKQLYYGNEANKEKTTDLLVQTSFFFGQSLTQLPKETKGVEKFQAMAIKEFDEFLKKYPKSDYAPKVLQKLGSLSLQTGKVEDAIKYFEEIPKKYPKFPGAKDIIYLIVDSAGKLGKQDIVRTYTEKMVGNIKAYSSGQLIRVGMRLIEFEMFDLAEKVMRAVASHPEAQADPQIEQRALGGLALSAFKRGNHEESLKAVDGLLTKYPKSANKLDMMFLQAASYREMEQYDKAVAILGDVTDQIISLTEKYPNRQQEFASAEVKKEQELALTYYAMGDVKKAVNSTFLLLNTRVARDDVEKAIFKEMCLRGIDWSIEGELWKPGLSMCEIFTETWPLDRENFELVRQKRGTIQNNL